jgi:hypothetical protein
MSDGARFYVTPAPDATGTSLIAAPDLRSALDEVRTRLPPSPRRLAIWSDAPAPERGPDVVVCVPVSLFESRRAQAEEVVARWDFAWLLLESMPSRHRDAAHQHLVDEISMALLAAAIEGVEEAADDDIDDVGF